MTVNNTIRVLIISVLVLARFSFPQEEARKSFIRNTSLYTGAHLEYWSYEEEHYFETVLPVYYSMDLSPYVKGLGVDAVASPVAGIASGGSTLYRLTGTKLRTSYNWNNLLLGTFGIQVPSGANNLSSEQTNAVRGLSARQMHFKVSRIGSGLDLDFTLSSSMEPADDFTIGLGLGLLTHGPFEPFENSQDYNPGNEFIIVAGVEYIMYRADRKIRFIGDAEYTHHTAALVDGEKYFSSGDQLSVNFSGSLKINENYYNSTSINFNLRGEKEYLTANGITQEMGDDILVSNKVSFLHRKKYRPYVIGRVYLFSSGENPYGSERGGAVTAGLGGGGSMKLSERMYTRAHLVVDVGGMNFERIIGIELTGGLNYDF